MDLATPTTLTAARSIELAKKAGLKKWSPNQMRHQAATEIRKEFDIEHAQASLGHSSPKVTEIYTQRDLSRACDVAKKLG